MTWLKELFTAQSIPQAIIVICLLVATGIVFGRLRWKGIGLGIAAVLFVALLAGHLGVRADERILAFAQDAGLIAFVYALGLQAGPGFIAALRKDGVRLNVLAATVVVTGLLIAYLWLASGLIDKAMLVGLYSGAVTNTPSLAAATQLLPMLPSGTSTSALAEQCAAGYAIAYPGGILGIIALMIVVRHTFPADRSKSAAAADSQPLTAMNIRVTSGQCADVSIDRIMELSGVPVTVSRHLTAGAVRVPKPSDIVRTGDILLAVGPSADLQAFSRFVGEPSDVDLRTMPSDVTVSNIMVNRREIRYMTLADLETRLPGVVTTRIRRGEVELLPQGDLKLHTGDILQVVGPKPALQNATAVIGSSLRELDHPQLIAVMFGILCGVILGSIPLPIPGLAAPVKLGLAGGPLVVALIFGSIGRVGRMVWHLPAPANFFLRELGIGTFLACVGLKAGAQMGESLATGNALLWLVAGLTVTTVPLMIVMAVARWIFHLKTAVVWGLLAGSMTDPPALAFAASIDDTQDLNVSYAAVYPFVMLMRVIGVQVFVVLTTPALQ